jgi:predicted  nucleic acid-binding Zn-ribbon protein
MAQKLENFQFPAGEKSEKSNKEFIDDLQGIEIEIGAYLALKKEYAEKKRILERIKKEQDDFETRKKINYIELKTGKNLIATVEKELRDMYVQIKHTSKKINEIISDPRYSKLRFKYLHEKSEDDLLMDS